jgi:hypothetical protein
MNRIIVGIFCTIFILMFSCNKAIKIRGTVFDTNGKPVPHADVTDGEHLIQADKKGRFIISIEVTKGSLERNKNEKYVTSVIKINKDTLLRLTAFRWTDYIHRDYRINISAKNDRIIDTNFVIRRTDEALIDYVLVDSALISKKLADIIPILKIDTSILYQNWGKYTKNLRTEYGDSTVITFHIDSVENSGHYIKPLLFVRINGIELVHRNNSRIKIGRIEKETINPHYIRDLQNKSWDSTRFLKQ